MHTLKEQDAFVVCEASGDLDAGRMRGSGFYLADTRYLSRLALAVGGASPPVGPLVADDGDVELVAGAVEGAALHVERRITVAGTSLLEAVRLRHGGAAARRVELTLDIAADFADVFEVRGWRREARGRALPPRLADGAVTLGYRGLDERLREVAVASTPAPDSVEATPEGARFRFTPLLAPGETFALEVVATAAEATPAVPVRPGYAPTIARRRDEARAFATALPEITTGHAGFDAMLARSLADLRLLATRYPEGPFPTAGIPWYCCPFGRDGAITALLALWLDPRLARGVLGVLAAHQATADDPFTDAEPGKILHEWRRGEMANLREIAFVPYYGTADATPLFLMLLGAYVRRTGDLAFARTLWPAAEAALRWIDRHGDLDGDGFVEYRRRSPAGLEHQGWKDSDVGVFHADGSSAESPIALVEVQGYVVAAKRAAAHLAGRLGEPARAATLAREADTLAARIDAAFWWEAKGTYALALDGAKRPCRVVASNAGHLLFAGVPPPDRAARVAGRLMDEASFGGWGVRTLASGEPRFAPGAYHNGSVWPHDNALIGAGFARYGERGHLVRLAAALFEAGLGMEAFRFPELLSGARREPGRPPERLGVSCSPQAWAAAAPLDLLRALLDLDLDAEAGRVTIGAPALPPWLDQVVVRRLAVGPASVGFRVWREGRGDGDGQVRAEVLAVDGDLDVRM
jgi:glycogen debranching enzyme